MQSRYLFPSAYMADPSAHVFDGRLYIYPSHDWDSGVPESDSGDHFNMKDYHVLSMDDVENGDVVDHGVVLDVKDVPWAGRQLWDCDVARKGGKYYMYFPMKDRNDVFRIGVAVAKRPEGPFIPQPDPMRGSYSIDVCAFEENGAHYLYFGGIWGGQLQRYRDNKALEGGGVYPADDEPAIPPRVARLGDDMLQFVEEPRAVLIFDKGGKPIAHGDNKRRFFEAPWIHKHNGKYYFSYSTGDTHLLCYATGDSPYGPFTYQGVILTPVVGWTTHHSIGGVQRQVVPFPPRQRPQRRQDMAAQPQSTRAFPRSRRFDPRDGRRAGLGQSRAHSCLLALFPAAHCRPNRR